MINDGESWLHQRRLMQPAFHRKRIATYGSIMTGAAEKLLERWQSYAQQDSSLDVAEEMMSLTLRIVGKTLFSLDLSDETNTIGEAVTTLLKLLGNYVYAPFPPINVPTARNRRLLAANRSLEQVIYRMIAERRQQKTDTGDLLSMLLLARDEETGPRAF
ncbi:MAG TPA: cytochrome P450 [Ktedonobacteraceae bacterium]|nr:cytochrome P450 [Ktedonobacteraceae bacterium]